MMFVHDTDSRKAIDPEGAKCGENDESVDLAHVGTVEAEREGAEVERPPEDVDEDLWKRV